MTGVALLLLLAAEVTVLRDDVNVIPPGQWRYEEFTVGPKLPADVDCSFRVDEPGRARVELVTQENLFALFRGEEHEAIATAASGTLHQEIGIPGHFALVLVNLDKARDARVSMRLTLDTSGLSLVKAKYLSPRRKLITILSSFIGFLAIVTFSARSLLLAMKR